MNDPIERQAAIEAIVNTVSRIGLHDNSEVARYGATFRQHEIIDIIDALPSAQPQIIRCRDCEYWYPEEDDEYGHCRKHDFWTSGTWFCADAERRDG